MPAIVQTISSVPPSPTSAAQQTVRPLLTVDNLRVTYPSATGGAHAVDGATFTVQPAEMIGLVGESGCGKTTVARALTGVMAGNASITGGGVTFAGRDLLALGPTEFRAVRWREIAFVPQSAMNSLDPVYRVEWQLKEVLARGGYRGRPARERAITLLDMVGLERATLKAYPHQLSGGMRQRVAIALALACDPQLMIADEPVTALDVIVQREVLDTLRELQQRLRLSVIMITHDISVVAYCCDGIAVMYAGKVVESGRSAAILDAAAHPYTMGLCNAFPDLTSPADRLVPILGSPPGPDETLPGCRFAPRCPFAVTACHEQAPPLQDLGDGHHAACWRAGDAPTLRRQATDPATWTR